MEVKKSMCRWCNSKCRVEVFLQDGKLEKIEEDKDHPRAEDLKKIVRSCPRSQSAKEWFYHPGRLNYPIKRAGEKGENYGNRFPGTRLLMRSLKDYPG